MKNAPVGAPFDLRDTCALKAVGILAIVLHNFFHSLPGAVLENEFNFNPLHFQQFLDRVVDPRHTIQTLFSYLGHFGVQLFIFLSAYGLALKYWTTPSWGAFVWARIKKLYPMFFLALGLWLLGRVIELGSEFPSFLLENGDELALTTLALINLVPGYGLPPVGPWWFLPFIVQFYCLWPALAAFSRRFKVPGLIGLSAICLAITTVSGSALVRAWWINLMETPVGHMPELCLGVACARYGFRVGPRSALLAAVGFILGNLYAVFWPLTFVSILVMLLYLYRPVAGVLRNKKVVERLAEVSMPLFFVNGFLRSPFKRVVIYFHRHWYVELAMGLCSLLFSVGVAYALLQIERRILRHGAPLAPEARSQ